MSCRIEDYALLGDLQTAALVNGDGSIDWLCVPRFDSPACFAALVGGEEHGAWSLRPTAAARARRRRYRDGSLVLETELETDDGVVRLIDFMPLRGRAPDIVRIVEGVRGRVEMSCRLTIRFGYGRVVPWVRRLDDGTLLAVAGPDAICLRTPVELRGENLHTVADFTVCEAERVPFVLTWFPSHEEIPKPLEADHELEVAERWWRSFSARCAGVGEWSDDVRSSLVVLKALSFAPTGGMVAAPTTSLPEDLGGIRNWDYRYCWLRDATFTLLALLEAGYDHEARCWRDWLLRAAAGEPDRLQIMYGLAGERDLPERELAWLPGYERSAPVRIGNAASMQRQLDVYGEVMDALYQARRRGLAPEPFAWALQRKLMEHVETAWREPDWGLWEIRGKPRHYTHSKVMAWVSFDRAVRSVEEHDVDGPAERWRALRDEVHAEVCERGYDAEQASFVQSYGSSALDASLLMIPLVGFLPAGDPRVVGTVAAIERELSWDGLVRRYAVEDPEAADVLPGDEGAFLLCSFWLVECLALQGRQNDAERLFRRLLSLRNDVGLLAEQYDPGLGRQLGNFPQAFSHVGILDAAFTLRAQETPRQA